MPTSFSSPATSSSPIVEEVMKRKKKIYVSEKKLKWALMNLLAAFIILMENQFFHIVDPESAWRTLVSYIETLFVVIFLTNSLVDFYSHLFPFGSPASTSGQYLPDMVLSPLQMKLLSVKENDIGFRKSKPSNQPKNKDNTHPYGFSSPLNGK